jgi:O-antigen ligase
MVVLIAAAMPVRLATSFPVVSSVSILDILLLLAAATLFMDLAFRPLDTGYRDLFWVLLAPSAVATASLVWSQDRAATLRAVLVYVEGLVAYLFVVRELGGLPPERVITYIKRYVYLLILPGVLLLLHVPGFGPQSPGGSQTSGDYISYFTRLSHPILGRSNNLATLLAFFAPLLLYWGHSRHARHVTRAGIVAFLAIVLTLSRGVLVAFAIGGLVFAPFASDRLGSRGRGLRSRIAVTVALGAIALAVFYTVNPSTQQFFTGRLSLANVEDRTTLLSLSVPKIESRPLLGYGAGVAPDQDPLLTEHVHNTYVQQVLYYGLPLGIVVAAALCATAGAFLARRHSSRLAAVIGYAVIVQLVIFLFESSFEGTVLRVLFYLSIGMAAALLRAEEAERRATVAAT